MNQNELRQNYKMVTLKLLPKYSEVILTRVQSLTVAKLNGVPNSQLNYPFNKVSFQILRNEYIYSRFHRNLTILYLTL